MGFVLKDPKHHVYYQSSTGDVTANIERATKYRLMVDAEEVRAAITELGHLQWFSWELLHVDHARDK
jgi:hypothetical protein